MRFLPGSPPQGWLPQALTADDPRPVAWATAPNGTGLWVVRDHALARRVLSDRRFGRAAAVRPDVPKIGISEPAPESIVSVDGAEHARLRRLVAGAFTERRVAALRPFVASRTADLLDKMAAQGPPTDLITGLASPLPLAVLCHLLGIPPEDQDIFQPLVGVFFALSGEIADSRDSIRGLTRYMAGLVARKRQKPGDDLLSALIRGREEDDDRLDDRELVTLSLALLMAGYETTTDQIGLSVLSLMYEPALAGALRDGAPERAGEAVEELLRLSSTAYLSFPRMTTEPVVIEEAGVTVEPGQPVVVFFSGANRRVPPASSHLAFGHGIHRCVGAPLARLQLAVVLPALLTRFPRLDLATAPGALVWKSGQAVRGLRELPVAW